MNEPLLDPNTNRYCISSTRYQSIWKINKIFKKEIGETEYSIATILKNNGHPNIVDIYKVSPNELIMESVNIYYDYDIIKIQDQMKKVKDHLQSLGIIYFDWKEDNIGLSINGNYKLFDFDACGLIKNNKWIITPKKTYWSYRMAEKNNIIDPFEMDNYAFDIGLMNKPFNDFN